MLRFGRLFISMKPQSASHVWRGVKSRRRVGEPQSEEPSTSSKEESSGEFHLSVAATPPLEECETDDEVKKMVIVNKTELFNVNF